MKRIVLAGGGTAGHVNPMLAVADELARRGHDIHILGTEEGLESDLVPAAGYPMTTIPRVPIPRRPTPDWFTLPRRLKQAQTLARETIKQSDVLLGFGGYVAAPAYMAAKKEKVPFLLHEQNARPGMANRLGAKNAAVVCLTFASTDLHARVGRTEVTGLPLRGAIARLAVERATLEGKVDARKRAAQVLGLDPRKPTLLVTGGSLGAEHLNKELARASGAVPPDVQILHLTGKGKGVGAEVPWKTLEYLEQMELALAVADLVLCRAGAGTVSELAQLGLPAVFVPLAIGNGEQSLNAADMVAAGAAILIPDREFHAQQVEQIVFPLLADHEKLRRMGQRAESTARAGATERVADLVEEVAK